jgi:hypothetical protein
MTIGPFQRSLVYAVPQASSLIKLLRLANALNQHLISTKIIHVFLVTCLLTGILHLLRVSNALSTPITILPLSSAFAVLRAIFSIVFR